MSESFKQILSQRLGEDPEDMDFALTTNFNLNPSAKALVFLFSKSKRKALFVARIARDSRAEPFLQNLHRNLVSLQEDSRIAAVKNAFPRPVFAGDLAGHFVQAETFLPGDDLLSITLKNRRHFKYITWTKDWLINFHKLTRVYKTMDEPQIRQYFREDIERAKQIFPEKPWLIDFLGKFSDQLDELKNLRMPFVFAHYDFAPKNVKFEGCDIRMIDWEHSLEQGLPLVDMLHFYLRYLAKLNKCDYLSSFCGLFYSPSNRLLRRQIGEYIEDIGIPPPAVKYLIVQHSVLRLIKVANYRQQLIRFFQALAQREISVEDIKLGN